MPSLLGKVAHIVSLVAQLVWAVVGLVSPPDFVWAALGWSEDRHFIVRELEAELEVVGKVGAPVLEDVPALVADMRAVFKTGKTKPVAARKTQLRALRRMIVENEDAILAALHEDLGRPQFEGLYYDVLLPIAEIDDLLAHVDEWAAPTRVGPSIISFPSSDYLLAEPLGTVLVLGTWNFPFMLDIVPVAGAIAAGNTCVLKPSNVAAASAALLADLIGRYIDPEFVTVIGPAIAGDRHTTAALMEHAWDHVFFTGSPAVGKVIAAAAAKHLTPVTLELGGKNPVFVDASADVAKAAKSLIWARNFNAGQQCISPDTVFVSADIIDDFEAACSHWIATFYRGDDVDVGRIVGDKQMDRIVGMLQSSGGRIVEGGEFNRDTRYFAPTVVRVDIDSPALDDETFGPILWLVAVDSMDHAIDYVNSRPKPLAMYVYAANDVAQRIVRNTSAGGVTINGALFHAGHPGLPFGGVGESGMGAYHGKATFDVFSHAKPVVRKLWLPDGGALSDPFFLYAPFTGLKISLLRLIGKLM